jgi:ubiquitin carboxyl-terminal hydrolase 34
MTIDEFSAIDYKNAPYSICTIQLSESRIDFLTKMLGMMMQMYNTIMSHSSDNSCINKFTESIIQILSVCPQAAYEFLLNNFIHRFSNTMLMLMNCTDSIVRKCTGKLLANALLIVIKHENIDLQEFSYQDLKRDVDDSKYAQFGYVNTPREYKDNKHFQVLAFLWLVLRQIDSNDNEQFYKKQRGYFKFWQKICAKSTEVMSWFITVYGISRFIEFYMDKKGSTYDRKNGFSLHELALEPLLRTVMHVSEYFVNYQATGTDEEGNPNRIQLGHMDSENLVNINFFEKMMKENYGSNDFRALRRILKALCRNHESLSNKVISCCLKSINMLVYEDGLSYLEVLKELMLIDDDLKSHRRDMILGIPTLEANEDNLGKKKFGLKVENSIDRCFIYYFCPIKLTHGSNYSSLLHMIFINRERNDTNCFIWLTYLIEMANASDHIFNYLVSIPSPCYMYSNYVDWIFPFVGEFLRKKEKMHFYLNYSMAQMFSTKMKDNLIEFEMKYYRFIRQVRPEYFTHVDWGTGNNYFFKGNRSHIGAY